MEWTLLDGERRHALSAEPGPGDALWVSAAPLQDALGWQLKPEGLCRGDVCIPVRDRESLVREDAIDLGGLARLLDRPLALDPGTRMAAIGESAQSRAEQMATLEAPDFALPDLDGTLHRLSDHRGKKVLLIAYASW